MRKFRVYAPELINSSEKTIENAEPIYDGPPDNLHIKYIEIKAEGIGDEYHSMHELYQHRMALTIALFNWINYSLEEGQAGLVNVFKSKLHNDGTMFDGYFIVMAVTPKGQISYHYDLKHWDKFKIPEIERCPPYDGHGTLEVLKRLEEL